MLVFPKSWHTRNHKDLFIQFSICQTVQIFQISACCTVLHHLRGRKRYSISPSRRIWSHTSVPRCWGWKSENDVLACFSLRFITCMKVYEHIYLAIFDLEWSCLTCAPFFGEMVQAPGNTLSWGFNLSQRWPPHHPRGSGERVTSRHRGILPSGSPTSGESAKSVRGVFSAAPPEALRPLGDVWWRSWWQPHVWKKGTIPGDAHFRKRSFLWGAKEGSYILKRGEGFESHKDYSMLLGPGCNVFYIGAAQKSGTYHRIIIRQVPGFPGDELVATAISCVDRDTSVALSWCEELLVNPHSLSRYLGVWHWSTWTRGQATSLWSGPNIGQWNGGCRSPNLDWGLGPPEFDIPTK